MAIPIRPTRMSFGAGARGHVNYILRQTIRDQNVPADPSVTPKLISVVLDANGDAVANLPVTLYQYANPYAVGIEAYQQVNGSRAAYTIDIPEQAEGDPEEVNLNSDDVPRRALTTDTIWGLQTVDNNDPWIGLQSRYGRLFSTHKPNLSVAADLHAIKSDAAGHIYDAVPVAKQSDLEAINALPGIPGAVRLGADAHIGDTSILLSSPVDVSQGLNYVVLSYYTLGAEVRSIDNISVDGLTVTLTSALSGEHAQDDPVIFRPDLVFSPIGWGAINNGATLSGVATSNVAAFAAAIAAAPSGSVIDGGGGLYSINAQVLVSNKKLELRNCTFIEVGTHTTALIKFLDADGSSARNVYIQGIEDSLVGADNTNEGFRVEGTDLIKGIQDVDLIECQVKGKQIGMRLENAVRPRVLNCRIEGFLTTVGGSGQNYHTGVRTRLGTGLSVQGNYMFNIGSGILLGFGTDNLRIEDNFIFNTFDNGIYASGSDYMLVSGNTIDTTQGSCVRTQGTGNIVVGNILRNASVGVSMHGKNSYQTLPHGDAWYADGAHDVVIGNVIVNCSLDGINIFSLVVPPSATNNMQTAQTGASSGTSLPVSGYTAASFVVSGTYTGITINWEASPDGGSTWNPVSVSGPAGSGTTATQTGAYSLSSTIGLTHVRARTTVSSPTGSITIVGTAQIGSGLTTVVPRHLLIADNELVNTASGPNDGNGVNGYAAIRGGGLLYSKIMNNHILTCGSTVAAIIFSGSDPALDPNGHNMGPLDGLEISGNHIMDAVRAVGTVGIALTWVRHSTISRNRFKNIGSHGIRTSNMITSLVEDNIGVAADGIPGSVVFSSLVNGNTGNTFRNNIGTLISVDETVNTVYHNTYQQNHQIGTGQYQGASAVLGTSTASSTFLTMNGASNAVRQLLIQSAGINRWILQTQTDETGSNAVGSDLALLCRNDLGAGITTAVLYERATGAATYGASQALPVANKNAAYTITRQDSTIFADAAAIGAFTVTLPSAVNNNGRLFTIKRTSSGSNNVTVGTTGGQQIDGASTYVLSAQFSYITVQSNNANWFIVAKG